MTRGLYYKLDENRNPVETDMKGFSEAFRGNRHVDRTERDGVTVSTVFLALDHSMGDGRLPIVFETLVFGGEHDGEMERYATWAEAEAGHKRMCEMVFGVSS